MSKVKIDNVNFGLASITEKYKNAIKEQKYDLALKYRNEVLAIEKEIENLKVMSEINNFKNTSNNLFYDGFIPKTEEEIDLEIQEALNLKLIDPTQESVNLLKEFIVHYNNKESQIDLLHPLHIKSKTFKNYLQKNNYFVLLKDEKSWEILFDFYLEKTTHFSYSYTETQDKNKKVIENLMIEAASKNIFKTHLNQDFKVFSCNYQGTEVFYFEIIIKVITPFTDILVKFLKNYNSSTHLAINDEGIEIYNPVFYSGNKILMACCTVLECAEIYLNKEEKAKLKKRGIKFLAKTPFKQYY